MNTLGIYKIDASLLFNKLFVFLFSMPAGGERKQKNNLYNTLF